MGPVTLVMVVYAGVVGPQSARVDRQLGSLLHHDAGIETIELSPREKHTLGTHGPGAAAIVRGLDVDGVVAGEVVAGRASRKLRVYVYSHSGKVRSEMEVRLVGEALDKRGITGLRDDVVSDAIALAEHAKEKKQRPPPEDQPPDDGGGGDDGGGSDGGDGGDQVQAHDDHPGAGQPGGGDDRVAESGGGGDEEPGGAVEPDETTLRASDDVTPLHMGATVGFGFVARSFSPGPGAIPGYASAAVGSIRFAGDVEPTAHVRLRVIAERSLGMTTTLMDEHAATTVSLWQADLAWTFGSKKLAIAPVFGVGRRWFSIESKNPMRSPDGDYLYLETGARAWLKLGKKATITARASLEPVVGGSQPTEAAFGKASRWAFDGTIGLDVKATSWLLVRGEVGYQRFSWSFAGGSGAVDSYPSAALSVGARY
jgi:hypothetical protein